MFTACFLALPSVDAHKPQNKQRFFKIGKLIQHDWFHVLLRRPTWESLLFLLVIWTVAIIIFAGFYMAADRNDPAVNCGLGMAESPIEFHGAFAFSLETCTTVGYGLPSSSNAFFDRCASIQAVIYFQMVWSMLFNAIMFAFFYSRVARCDARAVQVIFSDKAIVSINRGQMRFQARVFDVDARLPVVEAHVRMYAVMKNKPVPRPLRLLQPNDELGGMLFLSMPTVVGKNFAAPAYIVIEAHRYVPNIIAHVLSSTTRKTYEQLITSTCIPSCIHLLRRLL